ncbi:tail fiber protein [Devosia neptuniae]|uniref:Tail fiber protein n=1 Tax=Devosia neptuniae TaxID=191302 RepID=A0ABY6CCE0_9HYPH|nr:tail fiber protein [Devosia neptuniae]UXN69901.1 tail fiber protein [Devosia neptuniae]
MPRDGSLVYAPPPGTRATTETTIESAKFNAFVDDLTTDLNTARPVSSGGTGGTSELSGATGLKVVSYGAAQTLTADQKQQARANIGLDFFVGVAFDFAGVALPPSCIWPNGQNLSRATYPKLFAAWGTTYGAGDGVTTFGTPDLRGRVVAGRDDMGGGAAGRLTAGYGLNGTVMGAAGGVQGVALSIAHLPSHNHTGNTSSNGAHNHTGSGWTGETTRANGANSPTPSSNSGFTTSTNGDHSHSFTTSSVGSGAEHLNVQPTLILNKIIFAGV